MCIGCGSSSTKLWVAMVSGIVCVLLAAVTLVILSVNLPVHTSDLIILGLLICIFCLITLTLLIDIHMDERQFIKAHQENQHILMHIDDDRL